MKDGELTVRLPDCAAMDFDDVRIETLLNGFSGYVYREGVGSYHFTAGKVVGHAVRDPAHPILDVGKSLTVKLDEQRVPTALMYYAWDDGKYHLMATDKLPR